MAATITEDLMGLGESHIDLDYHADVLEHLIPGRHLRIYRGAELWRTFVLLGKTPSRHGITIAGRNPEWWLGLDNEGPIIEDREYISGRNKLSNGDFALGDLYWSFPEVTGWALAGELAVVNAIPAELNVLPADDVLGSEESFDTRPGNGYLALLYVLRAGGDIGRIRLRTVFEGKFTHPNVLLNSNFEQGPDVGWGTTTQIAIIEDSGNARNGDFVLAAGAIAKPQLLADPDFELVIGWAVTDGSNITIITGQSWTGNKSLRVGPIAKPQLLADPDFELATGWAVTDGSNISITTGTTFSGTKALRVGPIAKAQLLLDPDFESGSGAWVNGDHVVRASGGALSGSYALKAGPWPIVNVLLNPGFESGGLTDWYNPVSNFDDAPGEGVGGGTAGIFSAVDANIAHSLPSGTKWWARLAQLGIPFDTAEGSVYRAWGSIRPAVDGDSNAPDGEAGIRLSSGASGSTLKFKGDSISNSDATDSKWTEASVEWTPGDASPGDTTVDFMFYIDGITKGTYFVDNAGFAKIKGKVSALPAGQGIAPTPGQEYELSFYVRSGPGINQDASVRVQVLLTGSGQPNETSEQIIQPTKNGEWQRVSMNVTLKTGYTAAFVQVYAHDTITDAFYLDVFLFEQSSNNRGIANSTSPITITEGTHYRLSGVVNSAVGLQNGVVRIGARLTGPGKPDQLVEVEQGSTNGVWKTVSVDITPAAGYTTATVYVQGEDVYGAPIWVDALAFEKVEGNRGVCNSTSPITVEPGTTYQFSGHIYSGPVLKSGTVRLTVRLSGTGVPDEVLEVEQKGTNGEWTRVALDVRPDEGYDTATVQIVGEDIYGDYFLVDALAFIQTNNNIDRLEAVPIPVTPSLEYRWDGSIRSSPGLQRGTVKFGVRLQSPGRPDQIVESSTIENTENEWKLLSFPFTPPSGYDTAIPYFASTDVEGGTFFGDEMSLVLTDDSISVFDAVSNATGNTILNRETTAPDGAERVRLEIIAEANSEGWQVWNAALQRTEPTSTVGDIVRDLLRDPDLNTPLLLPGFISGFQVIGHDWRISHQTNRQALKQLARGGIALPFCEWRTNPDLTLDFGTEAELFRDREEFVFVRPDMFLLELPDVAISGENRVTTVKVIGAERQTPHGKRIITGEATATVSDFLDWFGQPMRRKRIIEDSTADHTTVAASMAQLDLDRSATENQALQIKLSDWEALGDFDVGDGVFVYLPESGLLNETNPMAIEGSTVFPVRKRVLSRATEMGSEHFKIEIRHPDETTFDLTPYVQWSPATVADLEVGDLVPEFAVDPQGGAAGTQFTKYRTFTASR